MIASIVILDALGETINLMTLGGLALAASPSRTSTGTWKRARTSSPPFSRARSECGDLIGRRTGTSADQVIEEMVCWEEVTRGTDFPEM
jgi:hypothetical protein